MTLGNFRSPVQPVGRHAVGQCRLGRAACATIAGTSQGWSVLMNFPQSLRYHREHAWVRAADGIATIGISDFAQDELGDIVFVNLPKPGTVIEAGQRFGEIESVKTVSDLIAPVSGEVLRRNDLVRDIPEMVNQDPYGEDWLIEVRLADAAEFGRLLTAEDYELSAGNS